MTLQQACSHAAAHVHERNEAPGRLQGKIAVVTGSAQGFGLGIAQQLYHEGACVVLADLPSQEQKAKAEAAALGSRAVFCEADVTDEKSVQNMVCFAVSTFGGLDLMVANAGVLKAGDLASITAQDFAFVTRVNYTGFFLCAKYAAQVMRAQFEADASRWSDIVQISSKSGLVGSKNNAAYAGSKFGGIGLTQSFALELAEYQIKVNAVCPGNYYDGPLWSDPENGLFVQYLRANKVPGAKTIEDVKQFYLAKSPIRRGCFPQDVAKAIFYCVEQTYETGQAIPVTGGQVMLG